MASDRLDTGVGVLDKGMAIVDLCEHEPSTATEIGRRLGISMPTAHRLAAALVAHGLLRRSDDGRFHLGPRFITTRLGDLATPLLQRLSDELDESLTLWVIRGDQRVCTAWIPVDQYLRVSFPAGTTIPIADGGSATEVLLGNVGPDGWVESVEGRVVGLGSISAPVIVDGACVAAVCVVVPVPRITTSPGLMYGPATLRCAKEISALIGS